LVRRLGRFFLFPRHSSSAHLHGQAVLTNGTLQIVVLEGLITPGDRCLYKTCMIEQTE
jgi:hypothetical protein